MLQQALLEDTDITLSTMPGFARGSWSGCLGGGNLFSESRRAIAALALLSSLAVVSPARAAEPAPARDSTAAAAASPAAAAAASAADQQKQIDAQRAMIESQQKLIEEQRALLQAQKVVADTQSAAITAQQLQLRKLEQQLDQMRTRLDELSKQSGLPEMKLELEERLKKIEESTQKAPELPPDIVSAGDFPGSIRIPGSDAAIKIGGRIRTSVVLTLDPLGTDDRFLTNSIPIGDTVASGADQRTNISARASRLNFEFRTPGGGEEVRAYFEGDFAGAGNTMRLRHAYAQYRGVIAGQTWSTFSDPAADHLDLDFEGVSSENQIRQPLLRYWWSPKPGRRFAAAIETPAVSITGGQGVNLFPDAIVRAFETTPNNGHLQLAAVLRQIRAQATNGKVAYAWAGGASASGVVPFRVKELTDRLIFQVNAGTGIARYINDLNSLGGQDAVVDTLTGEMKPLPAVGWYVAFEHVWKQWPTWQSMNLRSTLLWSFVVVDNLDYQAPDSYYRTNRFSANAIFSPSGRVDLGIEYLYGIRQNKDGSSGRANQLQAVALIRF